MIVGQDRESLLAAFWQALSHPIRIKVLESLRAEGPLNVGELVNRLGIGQGHLSNHLACLKSCGLVQTEPRGRFVYYHVSDDRVVQLLDLGSAVLQDHLDGVATCRVVQPVTGIRAGEQFSLDATEAMKSV
ncbi:MAG: transcriptional regulator [Sulfobacillus benefaciens]|jgi:ArsR family transcriptional regulator|uniref:Transcriptional regulator n=1 Tax=Sulfobacillus benefaciens TaxID=453960 RepID=A0A2T2X8B6_9FIRM|nr:MAG: transcriptional regulator [Sulfobacillus benefaciens]